MICRVFQEFMRWEEKVARPTSKSRDGFEDEACGDWHKPERPRPRCRRCGVDASSFQIMAWQPGSPNPLGVIDRIVDNRLRTTVLPTAVRRCSDMANTFTRRKECSSRRALRCRKCGLWAASRIIEILRHELISDGLLGAA